MCTFSPFEPWSMTFLNSCGRLFQPASRLTPCFLVSALSISLEYAEELPRQGRSTPCDKERPGSPTTKDGSISRFIPNPPHVSQAPCGELKENILGSISGSETPSTGHARFSENVRLLRHCSPYTSIDNTPYALRRAVSNESERRWPTPSFISNLSTTRETSSRLFLSSWGRSPSRRYWSPSISTLAKPALRTFSRPSSCRPFWPRIIGARTTNLVPGSSSIMRSTIFSFVCP